VWYSSRAFRAVRHGRVSRSVVRSCSVARAYETTTARVPESIFAPDIGRRGGASIRYDEMITARARGGGPSVIRYGHIKSEMSYGEIGRRSVGLSKVDFWPELLSVAVCYGRASLCGMSVECPHFHPPATRASIYSEIITEIRSERIESRLVNVDRVCPGFVFYCVLPIRGRRYPPSISYYGSARSNVSLPTKTT